MNFVHEPMIFVLEIDPCKSSPCDDDTSVCRKTGGGDYRCKCLKGYVNPEGDNKLCVDVNECDKDVCDQDCENFDGGYSCSCQDGFELINNRKCKGISGLQKYRKVLINIVAHSKGSLCRSNLHFTFF